MGNAMNDEPGLHNPQSSEASPPPELSIVDDQEASQEASFDEAFESLFGHLDFDRLRAYTIEDLRTIFIDREVVDIDSRIYHLSDNFAEMVNAFIDSPLPTEAVSEGLAKRMKALLNNTEWYNDEVEASISDDPIIVELKKRTDLKEVKFNPVLMKKIMQAYRVRRSILAYQYQEPTQEPDR